MFQIYVLAPNRIKGVGPDREPSEATDILADFYEL